VNPVLNEVEVRVLGSLVEKEITTPDYYPLSLNALINACNQKSNREPTMDLDEATVRQGLYDLQDKGLAGPASGADSRVTKYEHRLESFNFSRREIAILCVLLLRGPQTPGELRGRTERMYRFEDLEQVLSGLHQLAERDPALVKMLPRQPGTKEARYAHLLAGDVIEFESPTVPQSSTSSGEATRLTQLETEVSTLKDEIASIKQQFAEFRKQFD
jgi:uncharacterized protein YceH (UPF0502 family)